MRLPDGTVLMHVAAPYDPVKAHAYYLKTRELKGRTKGSAEGSPTFSVRTAKGTTVKLSQKQLVEQQVYAAKRVADIKQNLMELSKKLRQAIAEAKKKEAKSKKPDTAAEKSKKARDSEQYRKKNKTKLATKSKQAAKKKAKADPVDQLKAKISQIKGRLVAAVAIQRALASATKNN